MVKGLESAVHILELLKELCSEIKNIPMGIYTDNKSLHDVLWSHKHVYDKRLKIDRNRRYNKFVGLINSISSIISWFINKN